ncbi:d5a6ae54-c49d-4e97-94d6-03ee1eb58c06 [Thermothielavioides terrestris]
MPYTL